MPPSLPAKEGARRTASKPDHSVAEHQTREKHAVVTGLLLTSSQMSENHFVVSASKMGKIIIAFCYSRLASFPFVQHGFQRQPGLWRDLGFGPKSATSSNSLRLWATHTRWKLQE